MLLASDQKPVGERIPNKGSENRREEAWSAPHVDRESAFRFHSTQIAQLDIHDDHPSNAETKLQP